MKNRRYDYDVLRVCSMLGVIYLHVAAGALRSWNYPVLWNFSNVFACLSTPAVPLFFMMSGALLLKDEKTADLGLLFRKRIPKVWCPCSPSRPSHCFTAWSGATPPGLWRAFPGC